MVREKNPPTVSGLCRTRKEFVACFSGRAFCRLLSFPRTQRNFFPFDHRLKTASISKLLHEPRILPASTTQSMIKMDDDQTAAISLQKHVEQGDGIAPARDGDELTLFLPRNCFQQ